MITEKRKISLIVFVLMVLCLGFSPYSQADTYHYNNMLIGERAAGLGGAYTAIADDPSGLYYNPAGIVYSVGSKLSASMNAFYNVTKRYDKALGDNGWERKCATLLPNFFGIIQPFSKGKLGFSYAVTDAMIEDQDQTFFNLPMIFKGYSDYVINFNNEDHTYNFGPSYACEVTKGLSFGTSLYIHNRKNQWILNQYYDIEDGRYAWLNKYYELAEWGLKPVIGLMWSPDEMKYSFGLTCSHTFIFNSKQVEYFTQQRSDPNIPINPDTPYPPTLSNEKREYPYVFTFGAAYFPSPSLLFSGDISYYTDIKGKRRDLFNISFGTEYYFTSSIALRAGLFTDLASTYDIKKDVANQDEHVDMYGGGFNLSYFSRGSTLTLGISYKYGTGKAQIIENTTKIQDLTISSLMGYLGASYSF